MTDAAAPAEQPTPYDEFRYPGRFYPQASPERMAAIATLFGLDAPRVERCRVLEIGCGEGGHLVPLASALPESRFLGVDLSQAAISRAQALALRLKSGNVEFRVQDLTGFPRDAGEFDYIISHGVYSWVDSAAQNALLAICRRHLAPAGVAYVSYNTYPAAHVRQVARDLALFHTRGIADHQGKVREAHQILEFMLAAMPNPSHQRALLADVLASYKRSDPLTRFDLLSETNEPFYFLDFMEQAALHGLQYLAESDVRLMRTTHLPENARQWLDALPDRLQREQYLDFINWRGFRSTLLCRADQRPDLLVVPERMRRLMVAGSLVPTQSIADVNDGATVEFRTRQGQTLKCSEPLPKAVYLELGRAFPRALRYPELCERACRRLQRGASLEPDEEQKLIRLLVGSLSNGVVEFRVHQAPFCTDVSERPRASAVARVQAESPGPVSTLNFGSVALEDPLQRALLPLLDGSRDRAELYRELGERIAPDARDQVTPESVEKSLRTLASSALLSG